MHDELAEIRDFVAECPPFDGLDETALTSLTPRFVIRYLRRGTAFPPEGQDCLWLVRQGAIELRYPMHHALSDALAAAELFLAQAEAAGARGRTRLGDFLLD